MDSTLPLRHVGGVVTRALIPILGVLFLHWSAGNLLIVYFADTLASFFSVSVLAVGRLSGVDEESGPAWYRRLSTGAQLAGSGAMLAVILGGTRAWIGNSSGGLTLWQSSIASGQRGAKTQPTGILWRDGRLPLIVLNA